MQTSYKIENDNLIIYTDDEGQTELMQLGEDIQTDAAMYDALEQVTCNGLSWVYPQDIGALTDAPILSEDSLNGDDRYPDDAKFYWYSGYQVRSPLEDLRDYGKVIFTQN